MTATNRRLTYHAVNRFIERWAPSLTWEQGVAELNAAFASATKLSHKTKYGQTQWLANTERGAFLLVSKHDRGPQLDVCVTVLPYLGPTTAGPEWEAGGELARRPRGTNPSPLSATMMERQRHNEKECAAVRYGENRIKEKPKQKAHDETGLRAQIDKLERKIGKDASTNTYLSNERQTLRQALRIAVLALFEADDNATIERIAEIGEVFASAEFLKLDKAAE